MSLLGTILGTNEFTIKIEWKDTGKTEKVKIKARTEEAAVIKLSKNYNVSDKAIMTVIRKK